MTKMRGIRILDLPLAEIEIGDRVRQVSPAAVNIIAMSVEDLGAITSPIHVRKTRKGYRLIDGAHRFAVAQQLQMETIPAKVWECTDDQAALMESDANISMAHTSPLELAVSLSARKKSYQKLHPHTRGGIAGAQGRWGHEMQETSMSFAFWMADVFGVTPRQINRIIAAGDNLTQADIADLRTAPKQVAMADLYALSKIGEPEDRRKVCGMLARGEVKSATKAAKVVKSGGVKPPVKDPVDAAFSKLKELWDRTPKAAKRRFVDDCAAQLSQMLEERDA